MDFIRGQNTPYLSLEFNLISSPLSEKRAPGNENGNTSNYPSENVYFLLSTGRPRLRRIGR